MSAYEKYVQSLIKSAHSIYRYGSVVYGTATPGISDEDFVVVLDDCNIKDETQCQVDNCQYTFYPEEMWQQMIKDNNVCAMECLMLPDEFVVKVISNIKVRIQIIYDNFLQQPLPPLQQQHGLQQQKQ